LFFTLPELDASFINLQKEEFMKQPIRIALVLICLGTAAFADGIHSGTVQRVQTNDGGSVFFKLSGQSSNEWFFIDLNWTGAKAMVSSLLTAKTMGSTVKVTHKDASIWGSPAQDERYRETKTVEVE
jgi:hypothetical protein